jgi:hypothetical protein
VEDHFGGGRTISSCSKLQGYMPQHVDLSTQGSNEGMVIAAILHQCRGGGNGNAGLER